MPLVPYLTTVDNPYDPYHEFRDWYAYDTRMGYNTSALLARVEFNSTELSPNDQRIIHEKAVDEILEFNVSGMHRKVMRPES